MKRPGEIGAALATPSWEIESPDETVDLQIRLAGADAVYGDRHRVYEEEFNALVAHEIKVGKVSPEVGELAMSNFHVYMSGNRTLLPGPQTSPTFYQ